MGKFKEMSLAEARKLEQETNTSAAKLVADAIARKVSELRDTKEYKDLKNKIDLFSEVSGNGIEYSIDETGSLVSRLSFSMPDELTHDESGEPCERLAEEVLRDINDFLYFQQEIGTSGLENWIVEQSHGEPCLVNYPPERNCYAVFCDDLKLKVSKINSERHGLMLVERAVREHGYFPDIGSVDYYGGFRHLSIPADIRDATSEELTKMIEAEENEENE